MNENEVNALIADIQESYRLALSAAGIEESIIDEVETTVSDAIANNT